jgi:hypothetical protein
MVLGFCFRNGHQFETLPAAQPLADVLGISVRAVLMYPYEYISWLFS